MKELRILFPCDYFNHRKVDEAYKAEFDVATAMGFKTLLYDYDRLVSERYVSLIGDSHPDAEIMYRGWMLSIKQYELLYDALVKAGHRLINTGTEYKFCHYFDEIYDVIIHDTPEIYKTLTPQSSLEQSWKNLKTWFDGSFMIKDNVKSVKGSIDFPNRIHNTVTFHEYSSIINKFIKLRGDLFTGEIILKEFVELQKYGISINGKVTEFTNEVRAFFYDEKLVSLSQNSDQYDMIIPPDVPPMELVMKYAKKLPSNFFTIDFAERADGQWIILETGDGQVSGLSPNQNILQFYAKIQEIHNAKV